MSSYDEFLIEKTKIDELISQGYAINRVAASLDGDRVEFKRLNDGDKKVLTIGNADARKYFSSIIVRKEKELGYI